MKTWYRAVCDDHGEAINCFVNNPSLTAYYLKDYDEEIQAWFSKHYGCKLRLINECGLDDLFENEGYNIVHGNEYGLLKRGKK